MRVNEVPFEPEEQPIRGPQTYQPVPIPPRGEVVAWLFTLALAGLSGILLSRTGTLPFWAMLFTGLAFLLALSIRFSRWLEANTSISLTREGIHYTSPIRQHQFAWVEIDHLSAFKAGNGWRIVVQTELGGFRFQTATTLKGLRGAEVHTGYPHGDEIVGQILQNVDFQPPEFVDRSWVWRRE